jgi:translation elongation factor EF-1alpha
MNENSRRKIVIVLIILGMVVTCALLYMPVREQRADVKPEFAKFAKDYTENHIIGRIRGISNIKVSLAKLEEHNYDMEKFEENNYDLEKSYFEVTLNNTMSKEKEDIEYSVEYHLEKI